MGGKHSASVERHLCSVWDTAVMTLHDSQITSPIISVPCIPCKPPGWRVGCTNTWLRHQWAGWADRHLCCVRRSGSIWVVPCYPNTQELCWSSAKPTLLTAVSLHTTQRLCSWPHNFTTVGPGLDQPGWYWHLIYRKQLFSYVLMASAPFIHISCWSQLGDAFSSANCFT